MGMLKTRYLDIITAIFVTVLLLSNIASTKIAALGKISFDGGTILFPLAYIFGNILTEVYGFARARRVIWIGFAMNVLMVLTFWVVGMLPADAVWGLQDAYDSILGVIPRIVLGSLAAYLIGEFANSIILAIMKVQSGGKKFWMRALGSTIVGQALDTTVFLMIAFAGVLPWDLLGVIWVTNYVFKIAIEIVFLPVTYKIVRWLKTQEVIDYFDEDTNFSPIAIKTEN